MNIRLLIRTWLIVWPLLSCSSGPSPSTCYGNGRPGCEAYWKDGKPKLVRIEPILDNEYLKKHKIPDKNKYLNRMETIGSGNWKKSGFFEGEIRKAILECGSGSYEGKGAFDLMRTTSLEQYNNGLVLIKKCMINDGFEYIGFLDLCSQLGQTLPACQPDAYIPVREVNRRINGSYCLESPTIFICQPQPFERRRETPFCKEHPQMGICKPLGQESVPNPTKQPLPQNNASTSSQMREYPDKPTQLQQSIQKDSNRDMKNLLRNTAPKTNR